MEMALENTTTLAALIAEFSASPPCLQNNLESSQVGATRSLPEILAPKAAESSASGAIPDPPIPRKWIGLSARILALISGL
jgi:hypothetical protein